MPEFCLTYARVVILKRHIEAEDEDDAWEQMEDLEVHGRLDLSDLGLKTVIAKEGSTVYDIRDHDPIWAIEEAK